MSTAPALSTFERLAFDDVPRDASIRAQMAIIRALMDELERRPSLDTHAAALAVQIDEELATLDRMITRSRASTAPVSGIQLRVKPAGSGD